MISGLIPFNVPYISGEEMNYIKECTRFSGANLYTRKCESWLEESTKTCKVLITPSCTASLEMSALLLDIQPGDEVIMPSFTFVSTANAFVLRGATPVFVDIRADTLNINENLIEHAITGKTKAIVPVHYAGVSCEMDAIMTLAKKYNLAVVEDAAQGIMATYKGKPLGTLGTIGAYSFHETKNIIAGEAGALLVNDLSLIEKAEIIREKGTDRSLFLRGNVDKYTWQLIGSSYLASDIVAAFLYAQLQKAHYITNERLKIWNTYHYLLEKLEKNGILKRPAIPNDCEHNAHIYYIILNNHHNIGEFIDRCKELGCCLATHYVPLHSSPMGGKIGRVSGNMNVTHNITQSLVRLPLWIGLTNEQQEYVVSIIEKSYYDTTKNSSAFL